VSSDHKKARVQRTEAASNKKGTGKGIQMLRLGTTLLTVVLLTACATHPKTIASRPVIKRIAIIPASNPRWYSFENAAPPVGYPFQFWVNKLDSKSKAKLFNDKLNSPPTTLGADFTAEVVTALRGYGLTVEVLEGLTRPVNEPDNIDYDKVSTDADAILHLWISEVGLYSSRMSRNYIPRVNASGTLFVKGRDDSVYDGDIYYGVDAKKGKEWAIVPDAKFAYPSFEAVMSNIDDVRSAFAIGAVEISKRMSEQIYSTVKYSRADVRAAESLLGVPAGRQVASSREP
jgi:hypothetical protein